MRLNAFRAGTGPPLVLIHGIGSRWQIWNPVIERLAGERDVVAIDLPGFGESPMPPPGTPPGAPSLARLVSTFLDELGLELPHCAGNSLGGWISFELAKLGRVRSATGLSPAGFHNRYERVYQRASLRISRRFSRLIAPRADKLEASRLFREATWRQLVTKPSRIPPADAALHIRGMAGARWFDETLHALISTRFSGGEQIRVPVTIAWAEKDRLLLPRQARRAARAIPSARLVPLCGCGHLPTYDDPGQVTRVLLDGSRD